MFFSFMGIMLATPLSIQDSRLWRVGWRRRLRDAGEEEPDSRFKVGASGTYFCCKTKPTSY